MLYKFSYLSILDTTFVRNFKVIHTYNRGYALAGDIVLGVVRREMYRKRVYKKRKLFALLMTTKRKTFRPYGAYYCQFDFPCGLLLAEDRTTFLGFKFFAPITQEVRQSAFREMCQYSRKTF